MADTSKTDRTKRHKSTGQGNLSISNKLEKLEKLRQQRQSVPALAKKSKEASPSDLEVTFNGRKLTMKKDNPKYYKLNHKLQLWKEFEEARAEAVRKQDSWKEAETRFKKEMETQKVKREQINLLEVLLTEKKEELQGSKEKALELRKEADEAHRRLRLAAFTAEDLMKSAKRIPLASFKFDEVKNISDNEEK